MKKNLTSVPCRHVKKNTSPMLSVVLSSLVLMASIAGCRSENPDPARVQAHFAKALAAKDLRLGAEIKLSLLAPFSWAKVCLLREYAMKKEIESEMKGNLKHETDRDWVIGPGSSGLAFLTTSDEILVLRSPDYVSIVGDPDHKSFDLECSSQSSSVLRVAALAGRPGMQFVRFIFVP